MTAPTTSATDAWRVVPEDYPVGGYASDRLHHALRFAILAPSSHNSQPWLFQVVDDDAVDVFADRSRALPVVDPDDRELVISCGAALFGLRLALDAFGEHYRLFPQPDPLDFDLLARVQLTGVTRERDPAALRLLAAATRRRTTRMAFEARAVPEEAVRDLQAAAVAEGARLEVVPGERRHALADLVTAADRVQMDDHAFRRELAAWLHPNRSRSADGMGGASLGYSDVMSAARPLVVRTFDTGESTAAHDRDLLAGSPLLAVLTTDGDDPADWVAAGQALFHLLLVATDAGLAASFLDQPVEVPALRPRIAEATGAAGVPQLVLRLGYGPYVPPAPRRPLADVLLPPR